MSARHRGVERALRPEVLLRDRAERRERDRLREQLVERGLAELAHGTVDGGGRLRDRRERVHGRDRLGEDEGDRVGQDEHGPGREARRSAVLGGHRERPGAARAGQVDREAGVRPCGEEALRVLRAAAEERDRARLEGVGRERPRRRRLRRRRPSEAPRPRRSDGTGGGARPGSSRSFRAARTSRPTSVVGSTSATERPVRPRFVTRPRACGRAPEQAGEADDGRRRGVRHEQTRQRVLPQPPDERRGRPPRSRK